MPIFQPPPTYTLPIEEINEGNRKVPKFSRIWLKWFYDLVTQLNNSTPSSTQIIAQSPITGGGTLTGNVTIGFDPSVYPVLSPTGLSATITLAKITSGGANGSITFTNGVMTAYVQPT
jgi:hypothetical protein